MERIGVRELRQHASRYLDRVKRGERIEVTEHGTPVAMLVPIERDSWQQMIDSGRVRPAKGDLLDEPPLPAVEGMPTASEILAAMREHER